MNVLDDDPQRDFIRYSYYVGFTVLAVVVALALFFRTHVSEESEMGGLAGQVAALTADWETTPPADRSITFVLVDARAGSDPFASALEPSLPTKMVSWASRTFLRKDPKSVPIPPIGRSFVGRPRTIVRAYDGFSSMSDEEIASDIEKGFEAAAAEGADISALVHGAVGRAFKDAMDALEGPGRKGPKVRIKRAINFGPGMNALQGPGGRSQGRAFRPPMISELINFHPPSDPFKSAFALDLYTPRSNGRSYALDVPGTMTPASGGLSVPGMVVVVGDLLERKEPAEEAVEKIKEEREKEKAEKRLATFKNLEGHYFQRETLAASGGSGTALGGGPAAAEALIQTSEPQDSLSYLKAGFLATEMAAAEKAAAAGQAAAATQAAAPTDAGQKTVVEQGATKVPTSKELSDQIDPNHGLEKGRGKKIGYR